MKFRNNQSNITIFNCKIIFLFILVTSPLLSVYSIDTNLHIHERETQVFPQDETLNKLETNLKTSDDKLTNLDIDVESLFKYVGSLYQDDPTFLFLEADGGYATSIATYEALSVLRFFGLDYYQFGSDWEEREVEISNKLRIDLNDMPSGGHFISTAASSPSLEGSFGVITSLLIMNEIELQLKLITSDLLDFVYNVTFDQDNVGFHDVGQENSIKATYQGLTILDLIRKTVIQDAPDTQEENVTILEIMENYSVDILDFLNSKWINNSHFDAQSPYQTPIEDTWHALKTINILERYAKLLDTPLPNSTNDYFIPVVNWLKSLRKTSGPTKGGFGTSDYATVTETGMSYAILNLLNATEEMNSNETAEVISFIYSSQFLERENRNYHAAEMVHIGGFGPNNLTYSDSEISKRVNIHDTYYAVLTLLLSGDIFESIELSLETSHYKDYPYINKTNLIVQGQPTVIEQYFTIYEYKSHGSLVLTTVIDDWELTQPDYNENNSDFRGKSNALYVVNVQNDSQGEYNWSLGSHRIINKISIRNLPVIISPVYHINATLYVSYANEVSFDPTLIKPGENITVTIFYQNRSVLTYSTQNITNGNVSAYLTSPNGNNETWFNLEPINSSIGAIKFLWNVSKLALLGTWELTIVFNQSSFNLESIVPIEVTDTVIFYNISKTNHYYPGENMNLNVSLKYTNGYFTPNANASVVFKSNKTSIEIFSLALEYLEGNVYTSKSKNCPVRNLYGYYNVSIRLYWNSSSGLLAESVNNSSLPVISIKGIPTISKSFFKTDYRNSTPLAENNLFYYGETLNLTLTIGFKFNSTINNVTDEKVVVIGGLVNNTLPSSFIQKFQTSHHNNTLFLSEKINTNLPNDTFGTRFQIQSEWNNSYVYLRNPRDLASHAAYNFSFIGTFEIQDIKYVTTEITDGLYRYALDTTSIISISFQITNSKLDDIPVSNLNLYGILDIQNKIGALNQSLPSVTSAVDQNGTMVYLLSIPTSGLSTNKYYITIYSWTAIENNLKIGELLPGFSIIKTSSPQPIFQIHEILILIAGLIFIVLIYLNLKKVH